MWSFITMHSWHPQGSSQMQLLIKTDLSGKCSLCVALSLNICLHRLIQVFDREDGRHHLGRGPWLRWVYGMSDEHRCILLMAFWMHSDTVAHCCTIPPWPSPEDGAWWCMTTCYMLYTAPGCWKHPSSSMTSRLTGHVTCCVIAILWTECDLQCRSFKNIPNWLNVLPYLSLYMSHLQNSWSTKVTTAS